jgi:hypothetical protein
MPQEPTIKRNEPDDLAAAARLVLEAAKVEPIPDAIVDLAEQLEAAVAKARRHLKDPR